MRATVAPGVPPCEREEFVLRLMDSEIAPFENPQETEAWILELKKILQSIGHTNKAVATRVSLKLARRSDLLAQYSRSLVTIIDDVGAYYTQVRKILARNHVPPSEPTKRPDSERALHAVISLSGRMLKLYQCEFKTSSPVWMSPKQPTASNPSSSTSG